MRGWPAWLKWALAIALVAGIVTAFILLPVQQWLLTSVAWLRGTPSPY